MQHIVTMPMNFHIVLFWDAVLVLWRTQTLYSLQSIETKIECGQYFSRSTRDSIGTADAFDRKSISNESDDRYRICSSVRPDIDQEIDEGPYTNVCAFSSPSIDRTALMSRTRTHERTTDAMLQFNWIKMTTEMSHNQLLCRIWLLPLPQLHA